MNLCKQPAGASRRRRRHGVILPVVFVGLLVVALIGAAMVRTVLLQRRAARQAEQAQQSAWLADSALQRAQARLDLDADYAGETWKISADQLQSGYAGLAVIRIEPVDSARRIMVEAAYPDHPVHRILQRREKIVKLSSPGGS